VCPSLRSLVNRKGKARMLIAVSFIVVRHVGDVPRRNLGRRLSRSRASSGLALGARTQVAEGRVLHPITFEFNVRFKITFEGRVLHRAGRTAACCPCSKPLPDGSWRRAVL